MRKTAGAGVPCASRKPPRFDVALPVFDTLTVMFRRGNWTQFVTIKPAK